MENETQEASQESVESVITDEMLDRAAEGVDEEVVEEETTEESTEEETDEVSEEEEVESGEEPSEEEVEETVETESEEAEDLPEEPEDNSERSRLGRKVKELEDALLKSKTESEEKLNATLEKLNAFLGKAAEPEEEEFFEMPETKADFDRLVRERIEALKQEETTQVSQKSKEYEAGYIDTVKSLLSGDEDEQAIFDILDAEFNVRHSEVESLESGMKDAAKNVLAAKTKLLQSKDVKKVPLKGGKPKAPLGGETGSKMPAKTKPVPKLDPVAAEFARETGMTDEAIIKALG